MFHYFGTIVKGVTVTVVHSLEALLNLIYIVGNLLVHPLHVSLRKAVYEL